MVYWVLAISLGAFSLGYFVGEVVGYRKAHKRLLLHHLEEAKKSLKAKKATKSSVYDPIWAGSKKVTKLRLVKDEDTRE